MPSYELTMICKVLPKVELKTVIRRAAESILKEGGVLRKLEHLGTRQLPYRIRANDNNYWEGSYFMFHFDSKPELLRDLQDQYFRDIDIIRTVFLQKPKHLKEECTLHEELLPPAYRPEVLKLLEEGRRRPQKKFELHLDYYPF